MAYPTFILNSLDAVPCRGCHGKLRPPFVVSIGINLVVTDSEQRGLHCQISVICSCGKVNLLNMQLDRHQIDQTITELRLRGNQPPCRRDSEQQYIRGGPLSRHGRPQPSATTAPNRPISDDEVKSFIDVLGRVNFKARDKKTALLIELLGRVQPPPDPPSVTENETE